MRKKFKRRIGKLFIVSAPSGAGKTTLCKAITKIAPDIKYSVSYTTRPPRKGEINNVHYTFVSEKKFKAMIAIDEFAEWAVVYGNLYGTSMKRLKDMTKKRYDIILDIDTHGAMQMKRKFKGSVHIFVLPPSLQVLKQRITARMSESVKELKKRMDRVKEEMAGYKNYDYVIINDKLKKAIRELESIVIAERLRIENKVREI
ncbi:MAG: guanylate kinase [Nitrospirae bacterium]|nr:guanylate kinase [Nitrospirota bacterium]